MRKKVIEFENFGFQYKVQAKPTLKNINLTIYEGEKVLIVGPSGSGKSTITNCINGLSPFHYKGKITGSLKIMGHETNDMSIAEISKYCGTVLQDPDSQFIGLTAAEDIAFKLENDCVPQEEMIERVSKVSSIVDMQEFIDSSPQKLSGGQKQRVTLAGVMVNEVNILLFDEPLANLDPLSGKNAVKLIDDLQKKENKTIIIIEHRLEDVLSSDVDRIIVINDGEVAADMTPNELLCSNILQDCGIREPLYITALKYAGCDITEDMQAEHINTIKLGNCRDKVINWYKGLPYNKPEENDNTILELNNISFGYTSEKTILRDVSFKIKKGEMVSIVGKNGAGKSTISKIICGLYKPQSGSILFNGRDIGKDTIKERSSYIGIVMQNPNQMISKVMVFDEVAFALTIKNVPSEEITKKVNEVLKICGLYEFRKWPISALSFGQKKRVTIASILVMNPELIILDEPTAGQDFKHYTEIMDFLVELNKKGVTIVMITHDMHLMIEYTKHAIVFSKGSKIADDTAINVLTNNEIIEAANLKTTSVFELAVKLNMDDPKNFVKAFIDYDRGNRKV